MGLGYWWSLDFVGPLRVINQCNYYMLVMIERFPKWLKVMWLFDHSNEGVMYAFLDRVFNSFGILVEVLID
jgi:hypothetical protein